MNKLTLGADPELFLVDAAGSYIAACGLIGGTKREPKPLPIGEGYAVQEDNVAVEYNIPPASSAEEMAASIKKIMVFLGNSVAEQGLRFSHESAVSFPEQQLIDPRAREFGCDPDFNAWNDAHPNPRPNAKDKALRTCGGHVHVGYEFDNRREAVSFIQYMDLFLGVPSVLMDNGDLRKQLYGKAGAFRFKPYGVEYRSLSNFWVVNEKVEWVWNATEAAMNAWRERRFDMSLIGNTIQDAINNNNRPLAQQMVDHYALGLA